MRDGFIFYESFRSAMKDLPAETQLLLYNALADYALYDIEPDFDTNGIARGFFALMRPQIDANNRRRDAGARGGRPVKSQETQPCEHQTEANEEPNRNLSVTDEKPNENLGVTKAKPSDNQTVTKPEPKEKEKEKAKDKANGNAKEKENAKAFCADKPRRFTKPTMEDIREYCHERGNGIDPQRFFDFYEAKGWMIGSQPMKDWQAAVRTWESRGPAKPPDDDTSNPFKRMLMEEARRNGQDGVHEDIGDSADSLSGYL